MELKSYFNVNFMVVDIALSVLSAFLGAFLAISRENNRKPKILIKPGEVAESSVFGERHRFVHLCVSNIYRKKLWERFLHGDLLINNCKANIELLDPITKSIICSYQGRWSSTAEPLIDITNNSKIFDPSKAIAGEIETILPGESKELTVAVKFEGEEDFSGFNNWSYVYQKWKNPDWTIKSKSVYLRLILRYNLGKEVATFIIANPNGSLTNFRIQSYQKITPTP